MVTVNIQEESVRVKSDAPVQDLPVMAEALKKLMAVNRRMRISTEEMDLICDRFIHGPREFECDFELAPSGELFLVGPPQGLICIADRLSFA